MELALPQDFQVEDAPRVLAQARPLLKIPADTELRVVNVAKTARGTQIDFAYTQEIRLDDDALTDAAGVCVNVSAHGTLKFDARGKLVSHRIETTDPRQLRAMTDHLSKLVANGQIYFAKPGETIDTEMLRQQGKPWYVEQDADGNKYLKRAWMS